MSLRWGLLLPLVAAALAQPLAAQGRTISGTVTDSSGGAPIAGAVVTVRGGGSSAQSRENGSFVLTQVPDGDVVLVVRQIGYRRAEVERAGRQLGTGGPGAGPRSGEAGRSGRHRAVHRHRAAQPRQRGRHHQCRGSGGVPTPSIEQQLQGKVAGADIQSNSGAPGGGVQVRLRGVTSINSPAEPLYVVDGVIMSDVAIPPNSDAVTARSRRLEPGADPGEPGQPDRRHQPQRHRDGSRCSRAPRRRRSTAAGHRTAW